MKKIYLNFAFLTLLGGTAFGQTYVTQAGSGSKNGSSWANAYDGTQLQLAIDATAMGGQIWVGAGTYTPTANPVVGSINSRDKTFLLKRGVSIYGGFAGTESSIVRDLKNNKSILSGDFNGNDIGDINDVAYVPSKVDNAYHVIVVADDDGSEAASTLDGFTITGGYADESLTDAEINTLPFARNRGAAITSRGLGAYNVKFSNLNITANVAQSCAGGIQFYSASNETYLIENTVFANNRGTVGAGMYVSRSTGSANFKLTDVVFNNNEAVSGSGGAIYHASSTTTLQISNANFSENKASSEGGAIYLSTGSLDIESSVFNNNSSGSSSSGGAIMIASTNAKELKISRSNFSNNNAGASGGAVGSFGASLVDVSNCKFIANVAANNGGALYFASPGVSGKDANVKVRNSLFYNNTAGGTGISGGGAIYQTRYSGGTPSLSTSSYLTLLNNTFYENKSPNSPNGAISTNNVTSVTLNLQNNIFNGNTGDGSGVGDFRRDGTSTNRNIYNNLLQAPINAGTRTTVDNIYTLNSVTPEPLFASINPGDYNFLYPISNSFAIDKGDNLLYAAVSDINTDTHLAGYARLSGAVIDLGAVEYSVALPVTIKSFTAKLANNRTHLQWLVGAENNVNRYEIERSQNGTDFMKVAEAKATRANGYTVVDANPQVGVNYYRLKTIDNDATYIYYGSLQSVNVSVLNAASVNVYPNPVKGGVINVSLSGYPAGKYQYKLVNTSTGVTVLQNTINYDGSKNISFTSAAPAGLYILHLTNGDVHVQTKLIKQ